MESALWGQTRIHQPNAEIQERRLRRCARNRRAPKIERQPRWQAAGDTLPSVRSNPTSGLKSKTERPSFKRLRKILGRIRDFKPGVDSPAKAPC